MHLYDIPYGLHVVNAELGSALVVWNSTASGGA